MCAIVFRALLIRPVDLIACEQTLHLRDILRNHAKCRACSQVSDFHIKELGCSLSRLVDANSRLWSASLSSGRNVTILSIPTFILLWELKKNIYINSKKSKRSRYFNILRVVEINASLYRMRELVACFISICFIGHLEPCSRPDWCS